MKRIPLIFLLLLALGLRASAQWDRDVLSFRAKVALQEGRFAQAIEQFNVLAKLDTADCHAFFYRGIAKYNLGDYRGARSDFDRAIRLNPVFTDGYHYRAITENRFGRYDEALSDLERAMSLRPGMSGLFFTRGVTYFLARRFEKSLEDFNFYISKEPDDASAYLNRGATHLFLKDTTSALEDYNKAIRLDRGESEGYIRRGRVYAEQKKTNLAIADMTKAVELDSTNTLALFTRALMYHDKYDYNAAMRDFDKVLELDPGNALTLYNRSLLYAQVGEWQAALDDIDRVIKINPDNVLAHYNRASYYVELGRLKDAVADYSKAIELYPDFARAYMNRSAVELMLGRTAASKADYRTAKRKIAEYREKNRKVQGSYADTTRKYDNLLSLEGDFSKKNFNNELLQHRDIDLRLKPMFRFVMKDGADERLAFSKRYENVLINHFIKEFPVYIDISGEAGKGGTDRNKLEGKIAAANLSESECNFLLGLAEVRDKNYNKALAYFDNAVKTASDEQSRDRYSRFYKAFFLMNRAVLKAEISDFLADMGGNIQTLRMDDKGTISTRVKDNISTGSDYSEATSDMLQAAQVLPGIPFVHFNLGNLYCLGSKPVEAIEQYSKALELYPDMGEAYFNRALVLILVKDTEKGCIDFSKAGELGVGDAYGMIAKYCKTDEEQN